jgi:hypothetical protein
MMKAEMIEFPVDQLSFPTVLLMVALSAGSLVD